MGISEELHRLAELHRDGMLSYEEFTAAKQRLLTGDASPNAAGPSDSNAVDSFRSSEVAGSPTPVDDDQIDTVEPSVHLPGTPRPTAEPTIDEPDGAMPDVLLDDNGYTVTPRWVRVPSGKVAAPPRRVQLEQL